MWWGVHGNLELTESSQLPPTTQAVLLVGGHSVHATTFVLALDWGDCGETDKFPACRELFFGAGGGGEQAGKCFQFCVISKSCHQLSTGPGKHSREGMPVPDFEGRTGEKSDL